MKRLLTLLVFFAALASAQVGYVAYYEADLTTAASVVTVQQPAATAATVVRFTTATAYCAAACTVTLERTGTAATATALTPTPLLATSAAAKTKAWRSSDVGTGSTLDKFNLAAGATVTIDLTPYALFGTGTGKNLTLRTNSITGIARIAIRFTETN